MTGDGRKLVLPNNLTPQQKRTLEAQLAQKESKTRRKLELLIEAATLLTGKKGRGKTLSAVAISYNLRELYNIPTVCVGSKMGLKYDVYGPAAEIDERALINELEKITDIVRAPDTELEQALDKVLADMGVSIYGALVAVDEAYKLLESRTPSDKMVRLFGYLISQMRHYNLTLMLMAPHPDMIDKRVRRQLDFTGRCFMNKRKQRCVVWFTGSGYTWRFRVNNADPLGLRPNYYDMYETKALLGFRQKHLEVDEV